MGILRKLSEADRAIVMTYIGEEPAINLFMIGDIEAFGFDQGFQEVWGLFKSRFWRQFCYDTKKTSLSIPS